MLRAIVAILMFGFAMLSLVSGEQAPEESMDGITQEELVRRTQELVDAVAIGGQTPWKKYFADDCMFFDEKGRNMNKAALLADLRPMPNGYSGSIAIANAKSHIEGDVAILSYDLDEKESIFGQNLTARYHETDTWMRRKGSWQIVAGQVLRYYEDPAPTRVEASKFAEYVGMYELARGVVLTISTDGGQLYRQRGDRPKQQLIPEATDIFFRKGVEGRILFHYADSGRVDVLIDRRNNEDVVWRKVK